MSVYTKLTAIQIELKAPKSQRNTFGNYNYRSCEDILESVKPLLKKYDVSLLISDEIALVGDRYYVCATAELVENESSEKVSVKAYAREENEKKGMDASQITGATSSYARKYALNGLFAIDDTKDADTQEPVKEQPKSQPQQPKVEKPSKPFVPREDDENASPAQIELLKELCRRKGIGQNGFIKIAGCPLDAKYLYKQQATDLIKKLNLFDPITKTFQDEPKISYGEDDVDLDSIPEDELPF